MKTIVCLKYFVNDWILKVNSSKSLYIKGYIYRPLICYIIYTEKLGEVQYRYMTGYV